MARRSYDFTQTISLPQNTSGSLRGREWVRFKILGRAYSTSQADSKRWHRGLRWKRIVRFVWLRRAKASNEGKANRRDSSKRWFVVKKLNLMSVFRVRIFCRRSMMEKRKKAERGESRRRWDVDSQRTASRLPAGARRLRRSIASRQLSAGRQKRTLGSKEKKITGVKKALWRSPHHPLRLVVNPATL